MSGYGIAALMGLLGGAGTGAYKGVDAGIADNLNQEKLAEQKRQFDESKVIDLSSLPPELKAAMGVPDATGKVPTALAPTALTAAKEQRAAQVLAAKNANLGTAFENNTFSAAGQQPVSASAPGMLAPETRVADPEIAALGGLARAGEADKSMEALKTILAGRAAASKAQQGGTAHVQMDENGNLINVITNKSGRTVDVEDTGKRGLVGRNAALDQVKRGMEAEGTWGRRGEPRFEQEAARRNEQIIPLGPGGQGYRKSEIPAGGATNTNPLPNTDGTFTTPTAPSGQPSISRTTLPGSPEIKDVGNTVAYLSDVRALADRVEAYMKTRGRGDNAIMALRQTLYKHDPTGLGRAAMPLDKEAAAIDAEAQRLLREYENAKGGMRAVSGPQIQAALGAVHGGDALSNPNSPINLRNLADSELHILSERGKASQRANHQDIYTPAVNEANAKAAATAPTQQQQQPTKYQEGKRMYSPSQGRFYVIRGGVPVPE